MRNLFLLITLTGCTTNPTYYIGKQSPNGHATWLESEGVCMIQMKRPETQVESFCQWAEFCDTYVEIKSIIDVNADYIWCTVKAGLHQ